MQNLSLNLEELKNKKRAARREYDEISRQLEDANLLVSKTQNELKAAEDEKLHLIHRIDKLSSYRNKEIDVIRDVYETAKYNRYDLDLGCFSWVIWPLILYYKFAYHIFYVPVRNLIYMIKYKKNIVPINQKYDEWIEECNRKLSEIPQRISKLQEELKTHLRNRDVIKQLHDDALDVLRKAESALLVAEEDAEAHRRAAEEAEARRRAAEEAEARRRAAEEAEARRRAEAEAEALRWAEVQRIKAETQRIFDAQVEAFSEKAILSSKNFRDLITYTADIFDKVIDMCKPKNNEKNISAELSFYVNRTYIEYQYIKLDDKTTNGDKNITEQYVFNENGKTYLCRDSERYGFAWALMTLLIKEMQDRHPEGTVNAIRNDNSVELKYTEKNSGYIAPQKWV